MRVTARVATTVRVKIFRGTCFEVEEQVNKWLGDNPSVVIDIVAQTEADTNTVTLTVFYRVD